MNANDTGDAAGDAGAEVSDVSGGASAQGTGAALAVGEAIDRAGQRDDVDTGTGILSEGDDLRRSQPRAGVTRCGGEAEDQGADLAAAEVGIQVPPDERPECRVTNDDSSRNRARRR